MISTRFLLTLAAAFSLCRATTGFRIASQSKKAWSGQKLGETFDKSSSKQFASLAFPPDEADYKDGTEVVEGGGMSLMKRIKKYFAFKDDGMTGRQRLAKMGLNAILSYGFVQNVSYTVTISLAWYLFSAQVSLK
jgi:hypothetical protein